MIMSLIYFHRKKLSWKGTEEKSKRNNRKKKKNKEEIPTEEINSEVVYEVENNEEINVEVV